MVQRFCLVNLWAKLSCSIPTLPPKLHGVAGPVLNLCFVSDISTSYTPLLSEVLLSSMAILLIWACWIASTSYLQIISMNYQWLNSYFSWSLFITLLQAKNPSHYLYMKVESYTEQQSKVHLTPTKGITPGVMEPSQTKFFGIRKYLLCHNLPHKLEIYPPKLMFL